MTIFIRNQAGTEIFAINGISRTGSSIYVSRNGTTNWHEVAFYRNEKSAIMAMCTYEVLLSSSIQEKQVGLFFAMPKDTAI